MWEITLKCNLSCCHCGSRAGPARNQELSTEEALDAVRQLAEVGIDEVTLIGGEAFLRPDWLTIAAAISQHDMVCTMTTGGYGISARMAEKMVEAGIAQVSVSIDGLKDTHDLLRGRTGSYQAALNTLGYLRQAGMETACNTQINRLTAHQLKEAYLIQRDHGMRAWQLQLTVPMGQAADRPEILLQPYEIPSVFDTLLELKQLCLQDDVYFSPGNNVGYFGPYDRVLRSENDEWQVWTGCQAGLNSIGLEADGTIKGCPSLPTSAYSGGNIREITLAQAIENSPALNFNSGANTAHLWGFCQSCQFAKLCRGGCTWTSHVFFGRPGNNPYCHHRAVTLSSRGQRERLELAEPAPGLPFDHGQFKLVLEELDQPDKIS